MLSKKMRYCHHNYLTSGGTQFSRMHGIAIAYEAQYSYDHMQITLDSLGKECRISVRGETLYLTMLSAVTPTQ